MDIIADINHCLTDASAASFKRCEQRYEYYSAALSTLSITDKDIEALARLSVAEASNQGAAGIAGVISTVLNRVIDPEFPNTVLAVIEQKGQFEPVKNRSWESLPSVNSQWIDRTFTTVTLLRAGLLRDLTNGARFFQNPEVVQQRENDGTVSKGLTEFGGAKRSATIVDHAFYHSINPLATKPPAKSANPSLKYGFGEVTWIERGE